MLILVFWLMEMVFFKECNRGIKQFLLMIITNLNKMVTRKFIFIFIASITIYIFPELFFENALLYLSGGIIGGTLSEIFKEASEGINTFLVFFIWIIFLLVLVVLFFRLRNKPIKYLILLLIAFFLYIIDNLLAFIPIYEMESSVIAYRLYLSLSILLKSFILSLITYYGLYRKEEVKGIE